MEYQVQTGDTIAQLTKMMNSSWNRLKELNPHAVGRSAKNGNWFFKSGEKITDGRPFDTVLEQAQAKPPVENEPVSRAQLGKPMEYTIKPGDTLWSLAMKKFRVNMEDIVRDNKIQNPDLIQPGQKIKIPNPDIVREQSVTASWYGKSYHGRQMANGDVYNMFADTIAHKELPFGTRVELKNPETGELVTATVTDRGPFIAGRDVDLSYGLAKKLSLVDQGIGRLEMKILPPESVQI